MKLQPKVMFFDASRDFLPHYRTFTLEADPAWSMRDLYAAIAERDEEFDYDKKYPLCRIGGKVVPPSVSVGELVEAFGSEPVMDAAFRYRAVDDLVMDESDMERSWSLLESYAQMQDRILFRSLKDLHCASATLEFDKEYIGDAILVVAHSMIKRGHPQKEAILRAVSEDVSGLWSCEYENLVFGGRDYSAAIEELRSMATPPRPGLMQRICEAFGKKKSAPKVETLEGVPVAFYRVDSERAKEIAAAGAVEIGYGRKDRKAGQELIGFNPELAHKKGAALLLDAMDNGAELLVCGTKEDADYFRNHFGHFERAANREIYIEIVACDELQKENV